MPARIFISYSHHDVHLIKPLVSLLRLNAEEVFLDQDSLQPGKKWRNQIEKSIKRAQMVMVFWCEHAKESVEVASEYTVALNRGKAITPILLDDTVLPEPLSHYQWIDLRGTVRGSHGQMDPRIWSTAPSLVESERGRLKRRPDPIKKSVWDKMKEWLSKDLTRIILVEYFIAKLFSLRPGYWGYSPSTWALISLYLQVIMILLLLLAVWLIDFRYLSAVPEKPVPEIDEAKMAPPWVYDEMARIILREIEIRLKR